MALAQRPTPQVVGGATSTGTVNAFLTDSNGAIVTSDVSSTAGVTTLSVAYTSAQTDTAVVTVAAGTVIVVTSAAFVCDAANSVNVSFYLGFGAATTPTGTGVVLTHPGILALSGGGFNRGDGSAPIGIGASGEDLRLTMSAATSGSCRVLVTYYTKAA